MAWKSRSSEQKLQRWTATSIAVLPARPSPYTDPAQSNLQLLVRDRKDGTQSRTFYFRGKFKGTEIRLIIGHFPETSLADARVDARSLSEIANKGIDPRRSRPTRALRREAAPETRSASGPVDKHSIEYLASEFTARFLRPNRKRPEYAEAILRRDVLTTWRGRDARTIEPTEVLDLLDGIVDRGSAIMANRTASLLEQMFKYGIHRRIVNDTPVKLLMRPGGKEKPRERVLSEAELKAYLSDPRTCTRFERLEHVITLLLLTGQRRGELTFARWSDIDFKAKTWTIPDENAKAGRGHIVPLTDWAVREFQALKNLTGQTRPTWVLPAPGGEKPIDPKQLTRGLAKCLKRFKANGVEAFTLHDLRRTCRTGLARLKVPPHIAERVLNHSQGPISQAYDRHEYLDEKRDALEKWAQHLEALRK